MKIESVTLREIHMPLVHFFETSFGRVYSRRILLVSVEADGVRGWGECVAGEDPFYSPEWTETAWPTIKHYLAPLLLQSELSAGYRRIKIKVKPGWDLNVLEKIRARWADIVLSVDANSAYTLDQVEHLRKFDAFKLLMIEQPLWNDEIYLHARLQKALQTAICLDESILNARDADFAVEIGACRIINIKVGRVGGFSEAIKIHDVCHKQNIPVWCGGMLESGIGRAHNIALSTLENFRLPGDVSASKRYWKQDIIEPEVEVRADGMIGINDSPGTGYQVREDLVRKFTVREETFRAAR